MTKLICVSSGVYSDYTIHGLITCPSQAWFVERVREWYRLEGLAPGERGFNEYDFYEWILTQDGVEEVDYGEAHMGAYGHVPTDVLGITVLIEKKPEQEKEGQG